MIKIITQEDIKKITQIETKKLKYPKWIKIQIQEGRGLIVSEMFIIYRLKPY